MFDKNLMNILQCKFLCCYNVSLIDWQDILDEISWDDQKLLLDKTIFNPINIKKPIKLTYQIAFLKQIINFMESKNLEIHDEIYEVFCIVQSQNITTAQTELTYKHYNLPMFNTVISLKESNCFVSAGTTGLCSWQASLALSDWLLTNQQKIYNRNILELGAGTGLCGLVASKCCAAQKVIMSDGSPEVIQLLNENLFENYTEPIQLLTENKIQYKLWKITDTKEFGTYLLPWQDIKLSQIERIIQPNIILAADVVYDSSIFGILSQAIDYIFNSMNNQCVLILAATIRNPSTLKDFLNILVKLKFSITIENSISSLSSSSGQYLYWDKTTPIEIYSISRCS